MRYRETSKAMGAARPHLLRLAGIVEHVTLLEFDGKLRADEVLRQ